MDGKLVMDGNHTDGVLLSAASAAVRPSCSVPNGSVDRLVKGTGDVSPLIDICHS